MRKLQEKVEPRHQQCEPLHPARDAKPTAVSDPLRETRVTLSNRPEGEARNRRWAVAILMFVYFVSGACSLMDEVVWTRLLKLSIGNTVYASSVVISVFMGGLALGALLMSRFCGRIRKPLPAYILIESLITVSVLLSPGAIRLLDSFYVWFWRTVQPTTTGLLVCQTLLSAAVLLVPTILMGSTLPLLSRVVTVVEDDAGPLVGRLYALNTLGAAAGCFLAGFVLIRVVGVTWTLWIAAILNAAVVGGAALVHRLSGRRTFQVVSDRLQKPKETSAVGTARFEPQLLAIGFFVSGLACIGYEVLWMRSIVHSVGAFTYVFSAVLTVYLVGNVVGTLIGTKAVRSCRNPGAVYAGVFFLLGLAGVLYVPWLHLCTHHLLPWALEGSSQSIWLGIMPQLMLSPIAQCLILFLAPSILMGIGFPFMVQAWIRHAHRIGRTVGSAYSINTAGTVAGGLLAGFVCMPLLGLQNAIIALGLLVLWLAAVMWWVLARPATHLWLIRGVLLVAALFVTTQVRLIPPDLFNRTVALNRDSLHPDVIDVKTGVNTTVSIHRDAGTDDRFLYTSGRMVAGTSPGYRGDQKMLGHFPILLNQHADAVLSVGFGTGESTACLSLHEIGQNDCAEIAPEVLQMSLKYFPDLNLGDRHTEAVNVILMDARNYLHLTDQTYDVIVNDCTSIRGFAENSSLYTKDHFECARRHLNKHGLFMSWIDTYTADAPEVVNTLLGTMLDAFPHVTLWYMLPEPSPFFVVVGSNEPQRFSIQHIAREMDRPAVGASLSKIHIYQPEDVLSCYLGDEQDLRRCLGRYACNTDDRPFVEFCTAPMPSSFAEQRNFLEAIQSDSIYRHLDWTGFDKAARAQWTEQFETLRRATRRVLAAQTAPTSERAFRYCLEGLAIRPDHHILKQAKRALEKDLAKQVRKSLAIGDPHRARSQTRTLLAADPNSTMGWILLSQIEYEAGEPQKALQAAQHALQVAPEDLAAQHNLWGLLLASEQTEEARMLLDRAVRLPGTLAASDPQALVDRTPN